MSDYPAHQRAWPLIGDLQTAALVTTDGTIDFLCAPMPTTSGCTRRRSTLAVVRSGTFSRRSPTSQWSTLAIDLDAAFNTGVGQVFQVPGGAGLPSVLNLAAKQMREPRGALLRQVR